MKQRSSYQNRKPKKRHVPGPGSTSRELLAPRRIRFMGTIIPDTLDTVVTYSAQITLKNVANFYWAYPFYTNAPYDVDPALGSTATQGHAEMSNLYGKCRVISYTTEFECINSGVYPTAIVVLHRNTSLAAAGGSATNLVPYIGNPLSQHRYLAHAYARSDCRLKATHTIRQIIGSESAVLADNFASSVTSIPGDLTFVEIGAYINDPLGSYLVNGVGVLVTIRMDTRYYERKQLTV